MRYLKEFRAVTRALDARFEGKELVETDKPAPYTRCAGQVRRGASMVKGLSRFGPCEKEAVFVAPDGKAYCGTHGKEHGYTPPAKPEKRSWLVFYTRPDGKKSFRYSYDKVNEKGVQMAWKRQNPDDKIDGIIPYDGDAAFVKSAEYPKWKAWWEGWKTEGVESTDAAVEQLARIVKRYKKYERTDPDRPPAIGSYWSPRYGFLRVAQNVRVAGGVSMYHTSSRTMKLGLEIGSKFAMPKDETDSVEAVKVQQAVIEKLKRDAREVLDALAKAHGGYIIDEYGTAYSQFGWVKK